MTQLLHFAVDRLHNFFKDEFICIIENTVNIMVYNFFADFNTQSVVCTDCLALNLDIVIGF